MAVILSLSPHCFILLEGGGQTLGKKSIPSKTMLKPIFWRKEVQKIHGSKEDWQLQPLPTRVSRKFTPVSAPK